MNVIQMTRTECLESLSSAGFGRLACAFNDQPYIVPIYFVVEGDAIYSFALPGQKVQWMRHNPRVCLEIDSVKNGSDWTSVVVFGRFDELCDTPESMQERARAHELLQRRPMWWEPGAVVSAKNADQERSHGPIFFRILIDSLSGFRGVPGIEAK